MNMNVWKRSIPKVRPVHRDPARSRRAPSRSCRFQLENLEGRALLSTYGLYEYLAGSQAHVVVDYNGSVSDHPVSVSPLPTFVLNTDGSVDTVNIWDTSAGVPVEINGANQDTVNVGNAGSVQGILAPVTIDNLLNANTININDFDDPAFRTVTLSTVPFTPSWGEVTGLAPAPISYKYEDTSSMNLTTGTDANTVDVQATGVPTYITDNGLATVNVGDAGSVQGILSFLYINDPPSWNTININDSADTTARTAALSTFTSGWDDVIGLAPAPIVYNYGDTSSIHLTTNVWGDTIDVQATEVPTYISTNYTGTYDGFDTVNIGYNATVQGILAAIFVSNPIGYTAVNIDDSAHAGVVDATLSSFSNGPTPGTWGSIAGLAPAAINFAWNDMYDHEVNVWAPLDGYISWTDNPDAYESVVGVDVIVDGGVIIN